MSEQIIKVKFTFDKYTGKLIPEIQNEKPAVQFPVTSHYEDGIVSLQAYLICDATSKLILRSFEMNGI